MTEEELKATIAALAEKIAEQEEELEKFNALVGVILEVLVSSADDQTKDQLIKEIDAAIGAVGKSLSE